jgi:hypothetical protein
VTQEVSGIGLSLVYELSDGNTKKDLVNSLLQSLQGQKIKTDIKKDDNSDLLLFPENDNKKNFNENSNSEDSMNTYKELAK